MIFVMRPPFSFHLFAFSKLKHYPAISVCCQVYFGCCHFKVKNGLLSGTVKLSSGGLWIILIL
jgi:hypothetical protein